MDNKILFIDQYNKTGGGQTVLINLVKSASKMGFQCKLALAEGEYIQKELPSFSIEYLPKLELKNGKKNINDFFKLLIHYVKILKLIKLIKDNDIVYVNGPRYFLFIGLISIFINRKYIYHFHIEFSSSLNKILTYILKLKNTQHFIFTSNYLRDNFYRESVSNLKDKMVVIEPSLSTKFNKIRFENRFKEDLNRHFNFVSIGRIIPEKGFDMYLEIAKEFPSHSFYIIGSPENDTLEYYKILKEKSTSNVYFIGNSYDIPKSIEDLSIHFAIFCSKWNEPFGIVAIEAMACSCLTFTINKGGLNEISNVTSSISFDKIDDLSNKIENTLIKSNLELEEIAKMQFEKSTATYLIDNFETKLKKVFESIQTQ